MRKVLFLGLLIIACLSSGAQAKFGLNAGYTGYLLNVKGTDDVSYSQLNSGFSIGTSLELPVCAFFSIQPELNYFYLSAREDYAKTHTQLSYLYFPVLLKIHSSGGNFSIYAGPQLGFLVSAKNSPEQKGANSTDIKKQLTNTDFSSVFGVGYTTSKQVSFNFRYLQGYSNLFKVEATSPVKSRNVIFNFTIGYVFGK
jgi:Outer membrane protein beta-barrel domain